MKGTDFEELVTLGKMQAVHSAMNIDPPKDKELRAKWIKARSMVFEILDAHWDACNKLVTEDNT